jgi:predicted benzoate:H+ symporter BenE
MAAFLMFNLPPVAWADLNMAAIAVVGWLAQFAKAHKQIPTALVQGVLLGIGFAFYAYGHRDPAAENWLRDGIMWAFGLPGFASVAAGVKLAPQTDSIGAR